MMKKILIFIGVLFLITYFCYAQDNTSNKFEYLRDYRGEQKVPDDLYLAYEKLVVAFFSGEGEKIKQFCLLDSVQITVEMSREKEEYGNDINVVFAKEKFNPYILDVRKDSDMVYLLRTGSSALWFVKNNQQEWKLFKYLDKPIE